ncbi:MAG: type II toxin-antitoxin system HicB family antitoxin [Clostridiales Family XIII bacterium]|jgi:predicted HicB family RNase H-like nuclease|nr:type II toxin-antitoxin system HicB family antitoxin [Clostridiales Family XIII bacterium]
MNSNLSYKGYNGTVIFCESEHVFHGKVIGIRSSLTYEGADIDELIADFHDAIDDYLESCAENNWTPEKPFKGSFNVRIGADLHREAVRSAATRDMNLNTFVTHAIQNAVMLSAE